eukprot:TRINITY_DN3341_c0_g1_i5.p1 TRINITY_DN3341_c0_g1~~TRINITY_DN3341_c0_g1_i5.p1  ORF type:complete len:281 (+),score=64.96 TRINITY_DN3341_c0_g1_i5:793-1635(+)
MASPNHQDPVMAKIADFGLSRQSSVLSAREVDLPTWLAPEVLKGLDYSTKSDVYSFGIILWELITMQYPFEEYDITFMGELITMQYPFEEYQITFMGELEDKIKNGLRPTIPSECPEIYAQLIRECWDDNPRNRPDFNFIVLQLVVIDNEICGVDDARSPRLTMGHLDELSSSDIETIDDWEESYDTFSDDGSSIGSPLSSRASSMDAIPFTPSNPLNIRRGSLRAPEEDIQAHPLMPSPSDLPSMRFHSTISHSPRPINIRERSQTALASHRSHTDFVK